MVSILIVMDSGWKASESDAEKESHSIKQALHDWRKSVTVSKEFRLAESFCLGRGINAVIDDELIEAIKSQLVFSKIVEGYSGYFSPEDLKRGKALLLAFLRKYKGFHII